MLLSAEHLSINFGMRQILEDVSFYLNAGDRVGIIGINGTGKSTFLKVLAGRLEPDGGKVTRDPNVQLSLLSQNPDMDENATVLQQVFMQQPEDFRELHEYEAKTILSKLGLNNFEQKIGTLSGGQKKRLSIAIEFISDPSLFFLDEPDSGLDGIMATSLMENLRVIADEGKIVMVITHAPDRVCHLFDKVLVLAKHTKTNSGHMAFFGSIPEAKAFFEADSLEGVVKRINRPDEGGDGLSDHYIEKFAALERNGD